MRQLWGWQGGSVGFYIHTSIYWHLHLQLLVQSSDTNPTSIINLTQTQRPLLIIKIHPSQCYCIFTIIFITLNVVNYSKTNIKHLLKITTIYRILDLTLRHLISYSTPTRLPKSGDCPFYIFLPDGWGKTTQTHMFCFFWSTGMPDFNLWKDTNG